MQQEGESRYYYQSFLLVVPVVIPRLETEPDFIAFEDLVLQTMQDNHNPDIGREKSEICPLNQPADSKVFNFKT